jgi:hypothetical protein
MVKPSVDLLAQLFLLILRYIDLTICIADLDAASNRTLASGLAPESRHCSMQSACLKGVGNRESLNNEAPQAISRRTVEDG